MLQRVVGSVMRAEFWSEISEDANANGIGHVVILNNWGREERRNRGRRVRRKVTGVWRMVVCRWSWAKIYFAGVVLDQQDNPKKKAGLYTRLSLKLCGTLWRGLQADSS